MNAARKAGLLLATALLAGCVDAPSAPHTALDVAFAGRFERGATVAVIVGHGGVAFTPAALDIQVDPADAATVSGNTVLLLRTGSFPVRVIADGDTALGTLAVFAPPRIVLDAVVAGNRDIYSVALDGQELQRLTTNAADDAQPTAARGSVVFSSRRDGNAELYAVATDGTGERRLTTSPSVNEVLPALTDDGRSLAFVKDSAHLTRVWISGADLTGAAPATPSSFGTAGALESSPAWSSTGQLLAYATTATPSGNSGIAVRNTSSGTVELVYGSGDLGPEVEPTVGLGGAVVALASSRGTLNGIYVRAVGTGTTVVTHEGIASLGQPAWLADGRIVFTRFTATGSSLAWMDPALPSVTHDIVLPALLSPQHPQPLRP